MGALTLIFLLEGLKRGLQYRISEPYSIVNTLDTSQRARARDRVQMESRRHV